MAWVGTEGGKTVSSSSQKELGMLDQEVMCSFEWSSLRPNDFQGRPLLTPFFLLVDSFHRISGFHF